MFVAPSWLEGLLIQSGMYIIIPVNYRCNFRDNKMEKIKRQCIGNYNICFNFYCSSHSNIPNWLCLLVLCI